jgi:hypothetical protein
MMVVPLASGGFKELGLTPVAIAVSVVGLVIIGVSIWYSRKSSSFGRED